MTNPKGPSTRYLGTWDLGDGTCSTGFGQVYDYWVLGPSGTARKQDNCKTSATRKRLEEKNRLSSLLRVQGVHKPYVKVCKFYNPKRKKTAIKPIV